MQLRLTRSRRTMVAALAAMAVIATSLFALNAVPRPATGLPHAARERLAAMAEDAARAGVGPAGEPAAGKDFREGSQGVANGGSGGEAFEARTAAEQWAEARTAPSGIVDPGAYTAAYGQLTGLPAVGGTWSDVTAVPYDADDPAYRDYFSNSSGGSGLVTGRITALAAEKIESGLELALEECNQRIQRRTHFLAMIANVATLLGLFGTIAGLVTSFQAIGSSDAQERAELLAVGISQAMYATMMGLGVAIPCMVGFSFLMNKTNKLLSEVESSAVQVLDIIKQRYFAAEKSAYGSSNPPPVRKDAA